MFVSQVYRASYTMLQRGEKTHSHIINYNADMFHESFTPVGEPLYNPTVETAVEKRVACRIFTEITAAGVHKSPND